MIVSIMATSFTRYSLPLRKCETSNIISVINNVAKRTFANLKNSWITSMNPLVLLLKTQSLFVVYANIIAQSVEMTLDIRAFIPIAVIEEKTE